MSDVGRLAETLTIMMTDVEGSTALRLERGDAVADEILGTHARSCGINSAATAGRSGSSSVTDSCCPSGPRSTPSAAPSASSARSRSTTRPTRNAGSGCASGSTSARSTSGAGELYGQALHAAARVMAEAAGGQVLVSAAVREPCSPEGCGDSSTRGCSGSRGSPSGGGSTRCRGPSADRPVHDGGASPDAARRAGCRAGQPAQGGRRGAGRTRFPGAGGGRGRRRQVPPGRRGRARGRGARDAGSDRPLRGVGRRRAVPALRGDDRAGGQRIRATRSCSAKRSRASPPRSPGSHRHCGVCCPTSARPSSCRRSSRSATCGTASASSSPGGRNVTAAPRPRGPALGRRVDGAADRVPRTAAAGPARAAPRHVPGRRGRRLPSALAGHQPARAPAAGRSDRSAAALLRAVCAPWSRPWPGSRSRTGSSG